MGAGLLQSISDSGFEIETRIQPAPRRRLVPRLIKEAKGCVIRVTRLRPTLSPEAAPNSLSSRYGLGSFPKHTDYSTYSVPAHFIALYCPVFRDAETQLFEAEAAIAPLGQKARAALFRVQDARRHFSARYVSECKLGTIYRYNADCMNPINKEARAVAALVATFSEPSLTIDWSKTSAVAFDNWRYLHARNPLIKVDSGWLWRIAIWDRK